MLLLLLRLPGQLCCPTLLLAALATRPQPPVPCQMLLVNVSESSAAAQAWLHSLEGGGKGDRGGSKSGGGEADGGRVSSASAPGSKL